MGEAKRFFGEQFPELFARGVAALEERAAAGSEGAKRRLDDIRGARGVAWLVLDGEGELFLRVDNGRVTRADSKPDDLPVRVAVGLPAEAADSFVDEAKRVADLGSDTAAYAAARTASARIERAIGDDPLELHLVVTDTPDFDEVVVRIGLNAPAPPATPRFTATIAWEDLEAVRTGKLLPQQLFMSGKLRLAGDYSRALQVAMQLMQR
jgi:hypothetical protein